jgi:hypothetical protein
MFTPGQGYKFWHDICCFAQKKIVKTCVLFTKSGFRASQLQQPVQYGQIKNPPPSRGMGQRSWGGTVLAGVVIRLRFIVIDIFCQFWLVATPFLRSVVFVPILVCSVCVTNLPSSVFKYLCNHSFAVFAAIAESDLIPNNGVASSVCWCWIFFSDFCDDLCDCLSHVSNFQN